MAKAAKPKTTAKETVADNTPATLNTTFDDFANNMGKSFSESTIKASGNDGLDLAGFDYKNLTGEKFKEYVRLVGDRSYLEKNDEGKYESVNGSLLQEDKYDFILLPAKPVMVERFPGMKDTPIDYIGVKAKDTDPIHTTRIPVRTALEYNAQIINQHSRAGHGKYYFLKKN